MTPLGIPFDSRHIASRLGSIRLVAAALSGLAVAAAIATGAGTEDGPVLCVFRRCTGGYCPGCGASRATAALIRADIASAWRLHPVVLILAAQGVLLGLYSGMSALGTGLGLKRRSFPLKPSLFQVVALNGVLIVGVWLARLATGAIPRPSFDLF